MGNKLIMFLTSKTIPFLRINTKSKIEVKRFHDDIITTFEIQGSSLV